MQAAKEQGKARFVGLSTHSAETMVPAAIRTGILDVVLITYNHTMGSRLDAVIDAAAQAGLGVVAMKVMAHGKKDLKPGVGPAALKWVLKNRRVQTTIPSMVDMDQLEQNFRAMSSSFGAADQAVLVACLDRTGTGLLPDVRRLPGHVPEGPACCRHAAIPDLRRRLRPVRARSREVSGPSGGCPECPL